LWGDVNRRVELEPYCRRMYELPQLVQDHCAVRLCPVELLAEIGRLDDDDRKKEAATWLCENKPSAKFGVSHIRKWRNGKEPEGNVWSLVMAMGAAIEMYSDSHSGVDDDMVCDTLTFLSQHAFD